MSVRPKVTRLPAVFDPLTVPLTPAEQADWDPFMVLLSGCAIGRLPNGMDEILGNPGQVYYFQNDGGKICLTRLNNGPYIKTPARLVQQGKFADAVRAWQALGPDAREAYGRDPRAEDRRLPGYQFFLSLFLRGQI